MRRFVLVPHIAGWGHRVRCDTIGSELLSRDLSCSVKILIRRDDPVAERSWTVLPTTRSTVKRTEAILHASVLLQDGIAWADARVRSMKRLGGKLVLLLQPFGFVGGAPALDALDLADLILIPNMGEIKTLTPPFDRYLHKIRRIPIVTPLSSIPRNAHDDRFSLYCLISRPEDGTRELIAEAAESLGATLRRPIEIVGGFGSYLPVTDHVRALSDANVVVTQGTTSAMECVDLGIPTVVLPRLDAPEQLTTAKTLAVAGLVEWCPPDHVTGSELAAAILHALSRGLSRGPVDGLLGVDSTIRLLENLADNPTQVDDDSLLSIISTNYNCAHALQEHLRSIYNLFPENRFEYVMVDNFSEDDSPKILKEWAEQHPNLRLLEQRCTIGRGREIAAQRSRGRMLLVVDTDTIYSSNLGRFVERAAHQVPGYAVQAIYAGIFPRFLWRVVGGRGNFNTGEDFDFWMRIHALGRMRWYPLRMGENIKEVGTTDSWDFLSRRYEFLEAMRRLFRSEFDRLRLLSYQELDLVSLWKTHTVDLGLGEMEQIWFGHQPRQSLASWFISLGAKVRLLLGVSSRT